MFHVHKLFAVIALCHVCHAWIAANCPNLKAPLRGSVQINYRSVFGTSAKATYSCQSGYYLSTTVNTRYCLAGKWLGPNPSCVKSQCPFPAASEFGLGPTIVKAGDQLWIANYSCEVGYKLIGVADVTCQDGLLIGQAPTCQLDIFGSGNGVCNFSDVSDQCQYVNDANAPYQWKIKNTACAGVNPDDNGFNALEDKSSIPQQQIQSIALRPLPPTLKSLVDGIQLPISQLKNSITAGYDDDDDGDDDNGNSKSKPGECSGSSLHTTTLAVDLPNSGLIGYLFKLKVLASSDKTSINYFSLFSRLLGQALISESIVDHASFEVGPMVMSHAKYIKFTLNVPVEALSHVVFVTGHCLPDPPGSQYTVYVSPAVRVAQARSYNLCLNLHSTVRCDSLESFTFGVRITVHFIYVNDEPAEITFRPQGAYDDISEARCPGSKVDNE